MFTIDALNAHEDDLHGSKFKDFVISMTNQCIDRIYKSLSSHKTIINENMPVQRFTNNHKKSTITMVSEPYTTAAALSTYKIRSSIKVPNKINATVIL